MNANKEKSGVITSFVNAVSSSSAKIYPMIYEDIKIIYLFIKIIFIFYKITLKYIF